MTKINWQRVKHRHQPDDYSNDVSNQYDFDTVLNTWQNTSWPITGKHKGTKMKNLPLHYLRWVGLNFDTGSLGYKLVIQELECRTTNRT